MSRPTLLIALAALVVFLVGVIVVAYDPGPTSVVDTGRDGTHVEAPGTRVQSDSDGTRVQAPGVDITVPRRGDD